MDVLKQMTLAVLAGQAFLVGQAVASGFDNDFEEKPWAEIEVRLPAFPEDENLIPFKVGSVTDKQYLIDGNSLSVGSDEVIRYTLVVISATGVRNISYEGMRCATAERRLYAFGRSDKTWSKARSNTWGVIKGNTNQYHVDLFGSYFCTVGAPAVMSAEDARRALLYGRAEFLQGK